MNELNKQIFNWSRSYVVYTIILRKVRLVNQQITQKILAKSTTYAWQANHHMPPHVGSGKCCESACRWI